MPFRVFVLLPLVTGFLVFLCWRGLREAYRTGAIANKGRTSRRATNPIAYWVGMSGAAFALVFFAVTTVALIAAIIDDVFYGGNINYP